MSTCRNDIEIVSLSRVFGGGEVYIDRLLHLLGDRFNFRVVTPELEQLQNILGKHGVVSTWLATASPWLVHLGLARHLVGYVYYRRRPSAVLLNGRGAAYWAPIYKLFSVPVVIVRHTEIHGGFAELLYSICAQSAEKIISVSNVVAAQHRPTLSKKVHIIPNWLSTPKTDVCLSATPSLHLRLMIIGRLVAEKGLVTAVNAVLASECVDLDIYGEGPLHAWLKEISLSDTRVRHHGFVNDIRAVLAGPGLVLQASESESFSLSVVEAVRAGHLVIVSDIGAHREILPRHYPERLFFKTGDQNDLRAAIRFVQDAIAQNPNILEQAWLDAAEHVRRLTDPSKALDAYTQIFARVCRITL